MSQFINIEISVNMVSSVTVSLSSYIDPLSPSLTLQKVTESLADVISMSEMLTNQFQSETVATPWLQYVRLILGSFRVAD